MVCVLLLPASAWASGRSWDQQIHPSPASLRGPCASWYTGQAHLLKEAPNQPLSAELAGSTRPSVCSQPAPQSLRHIPCPGGTEQLPGDPSPLSQPFCLGKAHRWGVHRPAATRGEGTPKPHPGSRLLQQGRCVQYRIWNTWKLRVQNPPWVWEIQ